MFHIVLLGPEIPQNTGNIGRLAVSTESTLHLIRPLGFELDQTKIRRAGLDYWPYLRLHVHDSWESFTADQKPEAPAFVSVHGKKSIYERQFSASDYLIFGNETHGLPHQFYEHYQNELYAIPMPGKNARSLNLANAVSITVYEGLRQINQWGFGSGA